MPLAAGALLLRLWGIDHGLPYVYNADENAHFVPRAIGMFDHTYNPGYFINPPGYTYVLHVLFAALFGGGDGVMDSFAADPSTVFTVARVAGASLGALAVVLLALAALELAAGDRRAAIGAGALFAVAFLPVHYAHFALNDVPTLAPLCLALYGSARILRRGSWADFALAGAGLGVACATKYTAGIVLLCIVAAALLGPHPRRLWLAAPVALAGFLIFNPYALLDFDAFRAGLQDQSSASNDSLGKLGLADDHGIVYYVKTLGWGLGLVPAFAALAGAVWLLWKGERRLGAVLVPAPLVFLLFMGSQGRFFARWLLPVYPLLILLAVLGALALVDRLPRIRWQLAVAALCAQGLVFSVHNVVVLAREDTRQLAREWLVANVPEGTKVVVEPIAPDQWAQDPGDPSELTSNGNRWIKWTTSRSRVTNSGELKGGPGRRVKLEDYERTTRPALVDSYARGGFCYVLIGSTQYGRAYADPEEVPQALRYYDELERRGRLLYRVSPRGDAGAGEFSFDFSYNAYPLDVSRPGPEVRIYRLTGGRCGGA